MALAFLTFQKERELCVYFSSLDGHLSLPWKSGLQQPDLEGMKEEFLVSLLENVSQHLRLDSIYPARVSQASNFKMTSVLMVDNTVGELT